MTAYFNEFFRFNIYKGRQGAITRQVTFGALAIIVLYGLWRLSVALDVMKWSPGISDGVPAALAVIGLWAVFRAVNLPAFADFLIAVEAEMGKVSWPSRKELFRSSLVVVILILSLAFILACYDYIWITVFWFFRI